jgi:hypothetical protein
VIALPTAINGIGVPPDQSEGGQEHGDFPEGAEDGFIELPFIA